MNTIKEDEQKEKARGDRERVIEAQLIKAKFLRAVEVPVPEDEEEAQRELMLLLPVLKKSAGCVSRVWPGNAICAEPEPLRSAQGAGTLTFLNGSATHSTKERRGLSPLGWTVVAVAETNCRELSITETPCN